jgi:hypothetical protein
VDTKRGGGRLLGSRGCGFRQKETHGLHDHRVQQVSKAAAKTAENSSLCPGIQSCAVDTYVNKQPLPAGVTPAGGTMKFIPVSLPSVSRTERYIVPHLLVVLGQSKESIQRV